MTNEVIGGLKRLSWLPDRESGENGELIAGQSYFDVEFTGGTIDGVVVGSTNPAAITGSTITATVAFVGSLTGNAATATALQTARNIGGVSFNGTADIVPQTIQVADAAADTTTFPMLASSATGNLQPLTDAGLSYNASTNALTASTFVGALTGNADTATTATNATNVASANEGADTTCFPLFITASGTQTLPTKNNANLTFDASTATLGTTTFSGTNVVLAATASPSFSAGKMVYDTSQDCYTIFNANNQVSLQVGRESWTKCANNTGSTIANGVAVYITGSSGGNPTIALAQANTSIVGLGIATQAIANGSTGEVTTYGVVNGVDTSAFAAGATLYVSAATPGALTTTRPSAPNYVIRVGTVGVSNASTGTIIVNSPTTALGFGTANQVIGMNSAASAQEYKTVAGTANEITVTHAANSITASIPTAVTFTGKTITGGSFSTPTLTTPVFSGVPTGTVTSGTYTPTLFNTTNISASTAYLCQFKRVGDVVTVSGKVDVDPALSGPTVTTLGLSLPIASAFASDIQAAGSGMTNGSGYEPIAIFADATNDRMFFSWNASNGANQSRYFTFTYLIV